MFELWVSSSDLCLVKSSGSWSAAWMAALLGPYGGGHVDYIYSEKPLAQIENKSYFYNDMYHCRTHVPYSQHSTLDNDFSRYTACQESKIIVQRISLFRPVRKQCCWPTGSLFVNNGYI